MPSASRSLLTLSFTFRNQPNAFPHLQSLMTYSIPCVCMCVFTKFYNNLQSCMTQFKCNRGEKKRKKYKKVSINTNPEREREACGKTRDSPLVCFFSIHCSILVFSYCCAFLSSIFDINYSKFPDPFISFVFVRMNTHTSAHTHIHMQRRTVAFFIVCVCVF